MITPIASRSLRKGRNTQLVDAVVAIAIGILVAFATVPASADQIADDGKALDAGTFVLIGLSAAALAVRTRWPLACLLGSFGLLWTYLWLDYAYGPIFLMPLVAVFSYAMLRPLWRAACVLAACNAANFAVFALVLQDDDSHDIMWTVVLLLIWLGLPLFVGWAYREVRRARASTRDAEHERHRAEERVAMAREIHDVVGHSLAVVSMNAGVALHVLDKRPGTPPEVVENLQAIRDASTRALQDLRATLAPLRQGRQPELRPTGAIADLPSLVDAVRTGGLDVEYTVSGDPADVPTNIAATVYRVVQESLTNVIRHAEAAKARVRIDCGPNRIGILVEDDGRGGPIDPDRIGQGVTGMMERVVTGGGEFSAGPRPGGGFAVKADIPYAHNPN